MYLLTTLDGSIRNRYLSSSRAIDERRLKTQATPFRRATFPR
jgi:hypothetical protein